MVLLGKEFFVPVEEFFCGHFRFSLQLEFFGDNKEVFCVESDNFFIQNFYYSRLFCVGRVFLRRFCFDYF